MLRISWNTTVVDLDDAGDLAAQSYEHTLEFDCVTSETHEGLSTLTEHAVESGAPISDHKRADPERVTIEALVTNTPLGAPPPSGYDSRAATVQTSFSKDGDGRPAVLVFSAGFDRISEVISTLRRLRLEDTAVTLSTRVHTYEDVQIVGVTVPREPGDGDSVRLQIEIQQVRIAQSRSVDAPAPREPRGRERRDRGGQEGRDETTGGQRTSALQTGRDELARQDAAGEDRDYLAAAGAMFGG